MNKICKKPLILKMAIDRKIEPHEELFTYDPLTSTNRFKGEPIDYTRVRTLLTKTEQSREEDTSDSDYLVLDSMTKTFSSHEQDD